MSTAINITIKMNNKQREKRGEHKKHEKTLTLTPIPTRHAGRAGPGPGGGSFRGHPQSTFLLLFFIVFYFFCHYDRPFCGQSLLVLLLPEKDRTVQTLEENKGPFLAHILLVLSV